MDKNLPSQNEKLFIALKSIGQLHSELGGHFPTKEAEKIISGLDYIYNQGEIPDGFLEDMADIITLAKEYGRRNEKLKQRRLK